MSNIIFTKSLEFCKKKHSILWCFSRLLHRNVPLRIRAVLNGDRGTYPVVNPWQEPVLLPEQEAAMDTIYQDIASRTGGNVYIGVVGPVRTGKSTLIKRIMAIKPAPPVTKNKLSFGKTKF